jgi:hypothetical protein
MIKKNMPILLNVVDLQYKDWQVDLIISTELTMSQPLFL